MFDIGWSELLIIGIVALIVIGPKELPGVLRAAGHWMTKVRRMASEFQGQFQEAMREAEMADLKKEVDDMAARAQDFGAFDPTEAIRKDLEGALDQPQAGVQTGEGAVSSPDADTAGAGAPPPDTAQPPAAVERQELEVAGDAPKPGPPVADTGRPPA
jgi:sec-independent protein translocase protein TatB